MTLPHSSLVNWSLIFCLRPAYPIWWVDFRQCTLRLVREIYPYWAIIGGGIVLFFITHALVLGGFEIHSNIIPVGGQFWSRHHSTPSPQDLRISVMVYGIFWCIIVYIMFSLGVFFRKDRKHKVDGTAYCASLQTCQRSPAWQDHTGELV